MEKKTRNQLIIVGAVGLVAAVASYFLFLNPKNDGQENGDGGAAFRCPKGSNDNFPIKVGSCGKRVAQLQGFFNKRMDERESCVGCSKLTIDKMFGLGTLAQAKRQMPGVNWNIGLTKKVFKQYQVYF